MPSDNQKRGNRWGIGPFKQLLHMQGLPIKGPVKDEQLDIFSDVGILISAEGKIEHIDSFGAIQAICKKNGLPITQLEKEVVGTPGWIDAHTHICFAGSRAQDYALKLSGKSYLEIAKTGGGIWRTVSHTRAASQSTLTESLLRRIRKSYLSGITTLEVKSGYGLSIDAELKMLRSIVEANQKTAVDLIPTCLPAHIIPKDFSGSAKAYVELLVNDFFPIVQEEGLSKRADIFVEEGAFQLEEASLYLKEVQRLGFDLTIHADQFSTGGSELAIQFGAKSADHLEASGKEEIHALAQSNVIPIALPGASVGLGMNFTPGRRLLDAGASLAIATDWNPGSAPMGDLLTLCSLFGAYEKLTMAETLAGVTFRAAAALGLTDRGVLEAGKLADIVAFPTSDYRDIFYHQGQLRPVQVWKGGRTIN